MRFQRVDREMVRRKAINVVNGGSLEWERLAETRVQWISLAASAGRSASTEAIQHYTSMSQVNLGRTLLSGSYDRFYLGNHMNLQDIAAAYAISRLCLATLQLEINTPATRDGTYVLIGQEVYERNKAHTMIASLGVLRGLELDLPGDTLGEPGGDWYFSSTDGIFVKVTDCSAHFQDTTGHLKKGINEFREEYDLSGPEVAILRPYACRSSAKTVLEQM